MLSFYMLCKHTHKSHYWLSENHLSDWKKTENAFEEDNFLTQDRANESLSNVFNCLNFISLDVTST